MAKKKPHKQINEYGVFVRKWLAFVARLLQEHRWYSYLIEYSNKKTATLYK